MAATYHRRRTLRLIALAAPIVSQVALGPILKDVENTVLFWVNQDALIFASGSIAFEFIN
ncbi:hypothetical protein K170097C1_50400 [Hungatella effluvii]